MSTMEDITFRTGAAVDRLVRYAGTVANEDICALLEAVTDINDDYWNGIDDTVKRPTLEKAKAIIDKLINELKE